MQLRPAGPSLAAAAVALRVKQRGGGEKEAGEGDRGREAREGGQVEGREDGKK